MKENLKETRRCKDEVETEEVEEEKMRREEERREVLVVKEENDGMEPVMDGGWYDTGTQFRVRFGNPCFYLALNNPSIDIYLPIYIYTYICILSIQFTGLPLFHYPAG